MTVCIEVTEGIMQHQQKPSVQQSTAQNSTKNGQSFTLFVQEVLDNPDKFQCTVCMRQVACDHQGKRDIERHMEKAMHQANLKQMKGQATLGFI